MTEKTEIPLTKIYRKLFLHYGPQKWWPADSPFEVIIGAILTQNTSWTNVEAAIKNLKDDKCLTPQRMATLSYKKLARKIKPSGFFNIKAKRIKNFLSFLSKEYKGNLISMRKEPLAVLRKKILSVNGIGPETADSILLYAFGKPIFVIDAYTRRVFGRHKFVKKDVDYASLQKIFMDGLKKDSRVFNEYHALIVSVAKEFCRVKPNCDSCPLKSFFKKRKLIKIHE